MSDLSLKLVMVGDGGVGKTSLLLAYSNPTELAKYLHNYQPTVLDNFTAEVDFLKNSNLTLDIWDTAGQEQYDHVRKLSYPETDAFCVCYSVNSAASLENVREVWLPEAVLQKDDEDRCKFVLIGTKLDLDRKVSVDAVKTIGDSFTAFGISECSAIDGKGVQEAFELAIQAGYAHKYGSTNSKRCCLF